MAGYYKNSMSNNAIACYDQDIMPRSRWTKAKILEEIEKNYGSANFCKAKNFSADFLRNHFLFLDSWHHTGKYYNRTDFYAFREDLEENELAEIFAKTEYKEEKKEKVFRPVIGCWTEWEGRYRRYRKPVDHEEFGRTDGNMFYGIDGTNKRVDGKYFYCKEVSENDAKETFKETFRLPTSHKYKKWLQTGKI